MFKDTNIPTCLSYDDVMLVPTYTDVLSRSHPSTRTRVGKIELLLPIISSPMDTVTEKDMALAMSNAGGMGIIHRFISPRDQAIMLNYCLNEIEGSSKNLENDYGTIGVAIGVGDQEFDRLKTIFDKVGLDRVRTIAVDVANGHSVYMRDMLDRIRSTYGESHNIIAGNVATREGYDFLAKSGADAVRVGIGGGCFTPGTKVFTNSGFKPIEAIVVGDLVVTHTGSWKSVINTIQFERDEEIVVINGIESTKNHEYYVVRKSDSNLITEDNIHQYAFWVEADHLNEDEHLLIEMD